MLQETTIEQADLCQLLVRGPFAILPVPPVGSSEVQVAEAEADDLDRLGYVARGRRRDDFTYGGLQRLTSGTGIPLRSPGIEE